MARRLHTWFLIALAGLLAGCVSSGGDGSSDAGAGPGDGDAAGDGDGDTGDGDGDTNTGDGDGDSALDDEGSTAATIDEAAGVVAPPGALVRGVTMAVARAGDGGPDESSLLGPAYEFTPEGTEFAIPATISLRVPDTAPPGPLVLVTYDDASARWVEVPASIRMNDRVYAQTAHFSFFGVSVPLGPVDACREAAALPPGSVHPMATPNGIAVSGATKTASQAGGFSGPNPLELGSTWVADQRWVTVSGNAQVQGSGAWIDWSNASGGTFEVGAGGAFSLVIDAQSSGPFFGLTDPCNAPYADERGGWIHNLNIHCSQACEDDPTPAPPTGGSCGKTELCERTIGECAIMMTQPGCESWYDSPANCTDMDGYTTCNCDCVQMPTCDDYFTCGESCFASFCN